MPKFHVHCSRTTVQRVVLEVNAVSEKHALNKVRNSEEPDVEFEEVGFDDGMSDLTVRSASKVQE